MYEKLWHTSRRFKTGAVIFSLLSISAVIVDGQRHNGADNAGPIKPGPKCTGVVFSYPPGQTEGNLIYVTPLIDGRLAQVSNVHGAVVSGTDAGMPVLPTKYEDHGDLGYTWDVSNMAVQHSLVKVESTVAGQPVDCPVQEMTFDPKTHQVAPPRPDQTGE